MTESDRDKTIEVAMGDVMIPGSSTIQARLVISPELMARMAQAALTAYESHLHASGMAVVPKLATDEMIRAGEGARKGVPAATVCAV